MDAAATIVMIILGVIFNDSKLNDSSCILYLLSKDSCSKAGEKFWLGDGETLAKQTV